MLSLMLDAQRSARTSCRSWRNSTSSSASIALARQRGIALRFGVRLRLGVSGAGRWADVSGDRSKFGVSFSQLVRYCVGAGARRLSRRAGAAALSSRQPDSRHHDAGRGRARTHAGLRPARATTVFGPSSSTSAAGSASITTPASVVWPRRPSTIRCRNTPMRWSARLARSADGEACPRPRLITESGRALTAHHSVLVVPALGAAVREPITATWS